MSEGAPEDGGMLPLDSARWSELESAGGRPELVPRLIQALNDRPTGRDWGEVWEQLSHQWSGYPSAFAAVPHLVHLATRQGAPADPFDWLVGLCRAARQERVLRQVCLLFGTLTCPLCAAEEMVVMTEVERSHG